MKLTKSHFAAFLALCLVGLMASFTPDSRKGKWETLFNGKNFDGWKKWKGGPITGWEVEDGAMVLMEKKGGDLLTEKEYGDFELELEWKISERGNSGIMFHVKEGADYCCPYVTGPEIQVLDDKRHPDSFAGKTGNHKAGALYDLIPPNDTTVVKPAGEWNKARVIVKDGKGESWLNGKKLVDFPTKGPEWERMVANSKFSKWKDFGTFDKGSIALQDHGDKVWYRNIRVREL